MKTMFNFLFVFFCFMTTSLKSENAPVTAAGIITNATTGTGAVVVPVTVKNFVSIGSFALTMSYMANRAAYVSATPHTSFPGMTVVNSVVGTQGTLVITWPQTPGGVTLPDETRLLSLTFTYISGNVALDWDLSTNACKYYKYSAGSYIQLNDLPKPSYYLNGGISNRGAPVTFAPVINNPAPGALAVPVTVNNFTSVGAMTLTLEFNQAVLSYQNCTPTSSIASTFAAGTQIGPNGKMLLVMSFYGNATLANGSTLVTINFIYSTATATGSALDWYDTGSSCEYTNVSGYPYLDMPTADYYKNGLIYSQYAPKVWLPVKTNALPSGSLSLPLFVNSFNNVKSFNLSYEYDPAVMSYSGFTPGSSFGSALTVTDSPSGSKRKIVLAWTGASSTTLPDGTLMATMNFAYISGTTTLAWLVNDATSCRFNDAIGNAYYDVPKTTYYQDGLVASHVAPQTAAGNVSATAGQQVTVPLRVFHYSNIGLFALALDYDPSVLTYQSASLVPALGGSFTAATAGLGRILLNWSGTAASLADSSTLVNLVFTYNGGATTLAWFDDGASCRYAESAAGASLYDLPRTFYYVNGYVGPSPLAANFVAGTPTDDYAANVTLNDQTTGGPATWNWTISPSTYYFLGGTTAASQNPQVHFTSNGAYTVTLIVTRGTAGSIRVRTDYLYIGTPGLWTGITSTDWNTGSNWHNYQVPPASVNVTIPAAAANWPHKTGNLTLGALCGNVSVEGAAKLYVEGNMTINPGYTLTCTGAGSLYIAGNWANSGVFNAGTSTVEFYGPSDTYILGGAASETFYYMALSKANATVFVQRNLFITGP
ncbi:MAG: cohesin domain-containing protein [bacterium]